MDSYTRMEVALRILALGGEGDLQTKAREVLKKILDEEIN